MIIVASVSCIYGLGDPKEYYDSVITFKVGDEYNRRLLLLSLTDMQYERNDIELKSGRYRVKGDVIDIFPSWELHLIRLEFFGDELDRISLVHAVSGEVLERLNTVDLFPATHYVVSDGLEAPLKAIEEELETQLKVLKSQGKELESHRLNQRTRYDMDMMSEIGYCKGVENYSRHLSGGKPGDAPGVLLDFFPDDFITIIDESHVTIPQVKGMYKGDQSRKQVLVDYGFRLPSALDNRPLSFEEFESKLGSCIYTSATPGPYELEKCQLDEEDTSRSDSFWSAYDVVEQVVRPTGLLDPKIFIHPTEYQVEHLIGESIKRINQKERVLVTTVTKKMSEDLADYMSNRDIKCRYLHSDIDALERIDILHALRRGDFDVLIGVNLLREGLDLPEVSLVAIMDADKEGFLRNERSLIQTMGRAARNANGVVYLYADKVTDSMKKAIDETQRRRAKQEAHNKANGIVPKTIFKSLHDIRDEVREEIESLPKADDDIDPNLLPVLLESLNKQMKEAAKREEFEVAAVIRDRIQDLKDRLDKV